MTNNLKKYYQPYFFLVFKKHRTMSNKTLLEIYKERKSLPTPAMNFIRELSQVTHRSEMTVKGWLTGKFRPDINTQIVLAHHLNSEANILFPPKSEES